MTRDELKDLACLGFSADLVMQSFCHTAAYPNGEIRGQFTQARAPSLSRPVQTPTENGSNADEG